MSNLNSQYNRVVWVDIPVADLDRSAAFYTAVIGHPVHLEQFGDVRFGVLDHQDGNGGCLMLRPEEITSTAGVLVYLNVDGRIRDAVAQAEAHGGKIVQPVHTIGQHGCRAVIIDSEGNRMALHSTVDQ